MKSKLILVSTIATVLLLFVACTPTPKESSVQVSCDDFIKNQHISKVVEVNAGDSFTVTLCSNPTTGFLWSETAQIGDLTVLEQAEHEFIPPEATGDKPPAPGTSGKEVWTFKALKKGMTEASMEYSRPWEGGEKGEWTFNLTVIVK